MYVRDILRDKGENVVSLATNEPVADGLSLMAEKHIGALLITGQDGAIAGILSERDIVTALHNHGEGIFGKTVGELMTSKVVTCSPQDPIVAIMGMMTAKRFRHVPVLENGKLVGLISIGDVVKFRIEETEAEAEALRKYIAL